MHSQAGPWWLRGSDKALLTPTVVRFLHFVDSGKQIFSNQELEVSGRSK
jgi:hypothetical protein